MPTSDLRQTDAVTLRRKPERGSYDRDAANAILDEALIAHVGISTDGQPFVLPMAFGRDGDRLFLHGSVASRLQRALDSGVPVCITVTIVDDLVLSRSWFHHSMNFRSVVIVGTAKRITDEDAARAALGHIVDHMIRGRTSESRPPTDVELRKTMVLEVPIDTASVKVRTDSVVEDPDDLALPYWGGTVPVRTTFGTPEPDAYVNGVATPAVLEGYAR